MPLVAVELTPEQAALFKLYMLHYHTIDFMLRAGVFDIKQGSATLNFDPAGNLKSIERKLFTYAIDTVPVTVSM